MRTQESNRSTRESSEELFKHWLEEAACKEESEMIQLHLWCRTWRKVGQGDPGQTQRLNNHIWASTAADLKQHFKKTALTRCGGQTRENQQAGKLVRRLF